MSSSKKSSGRFTNSILGGLIGFVLAILGNLVSGWIEHDLFGNLFSRNGILIIFILSLLGIFVSAKLTNRDLDNIQLGDKVLISKVRLLWSRLKIRGSGTKIENVKSVNSIIDIDTKGK